MPKLGTFLTSLAKKSNIDITQPAFVELLAHDIDIPDDIATAMDKALMNEDAAKTKLRSTLRTEALNGVDTRIEELLAELGYEDAAVADIKGEKNSYEKIAKLTRTIRDLESKKAGAKGEGKEALEKRIDKLVADLKDANQKLVDRETEFTQTRQSDLTRFDLHKKLLGKDYALPKEMDGDLKLATAEGAVNKALAAKGYKIARTDSGLHLVDKDGNDAYSDTHERVLLDSFIDGALAQNKLLRVSDQSQQNGGGNTGQQSHISSTGGTGNAQAVAEIDAQMKELGL